MSHLKIFSSSIRDSSASSVLKVLVCWVVFIHSCDTLQSQPLSNRGGQKRRGYGRKAQHAQGHKGCKHQGPGWLQIARSWHKMSIFAWLCVVMQRLTSYVMTGQSAIIQDLDVCTPYGLGHVGLYDHDLFFSALHDYLKAYSLMSNRQLSQNFQNLNYLHTPLRSTLSQRN